MKPLIIANWKMNPSSRKEAVSLARLVSHGINYIDRVEVIIAPPVPFLEAVRIHIGRKLKLGAQNLSSEQQGALTGEVSGKMLKDLGANTVIVGHSERRRIIGESDTLINKKMKAALSAGLHPVLAIGEAEPEAHDVVPPVLSQQLMHGLAGVSKRDFRRITIAYEPVWAIGTGIADTPDNATRRAIYIRKILTKLAGRTNAEAMRILYGGSVTSKNAASYLASDIRGMDGLLVGGASLKAHEFVAIVSEIARLRRRV